MPSFDNLKEEIREVYHIFDEDEAGNMSMAELARALYTITGERLPRSVLRKMVTAARESLARRGEEASADALGDERHGAGEHESRSNGSSTPSSPKPTSATASAVAGARASSVANSVLSGRHAGQGRSTNNMSVVAEEGIDADLFEEIVLRKLNSRKHEEEIAYTFALLEDQYYPGFITKESLQRAAREAEEPLTQAELAEMFDALVTGAPAAAVDLVTFRSVQEAALKAHEADLQELITAEVEATTATPDDAALTSSAPRQDEGANEVGLSTTG